MREAKEIANIVEWVPSENEFTLLHRDALEKLIKIAQRETAEAFAQHIYAKQDDGWWVDGSLQRFLEEAGIK